MTVCFNRSGRKCTCFAERPLRCYSCDSSSLPKTHLFKFELLFILLSSHMYMIQKGLSGKLGDYVIKKEFKGLWQVGWSLGRCSGLVARRLESRLKVLVEVLA